MPIDPHERAKELIAQQMVEGIGGADREWLERHIAGCDACGAHARSIENAIRNFRSTPVTLPPDLASRTQLRVYLRSRSAPAFGRTMWVALALCWALGVASAPYVWRGFEWLGQFAGIPALILKIGFGLWWAAPAAIAGGIWMLEKRIIEEREL
jgi:hypothetical protein